MILNSDGVVRIVMAGETHVCTLNRTTDKGFRVTHLNNKTCSRIRVFESQVCGR